LTNQPKVNKFEFNLKSCYLINLYSSKLIKWLDERNVDLKKCVNKPEIQENMYFYLGKKR